ncbi:MAG TPA: putative Ig domain-containing protein, partial [Gammaproteobacteria bacterium]|nr:putative Ig domain-containing protein [Gammaproteobacteria bacterium]
IDLVTGREPDFQMVSVMLDWYRRAVNINPFSTLIVRIAQLLPGGVNAENIGKATAIVRDNLNFGLDPEVIPDPINTPISDVNAASLTKSSEVAGEMIRRTRDLLAETGREINGDDVLGAIAADLQDGRLDGQGAEGTDPRITAVARVVTGQVLVEALANTLKVGGVVATRVIDQAIMTTRSDSEDVILTRSLRVTEDLLQQTREALAAARALDSSEEVLALESIVSDIPAGTLPGDVARYLPSDSSRSLDNAVLLALTAGETQLAAVNAAGQTGVPDAGATDPVYAGDTEPDTSAPDTSTPDTSTPDTSIPATVNSAPVISGFPALSVDAGTDYHFQPVASDADGDVLTFSISGKPDWADFDPTTGQLSGTPFDTDSGTYRDIAIAVTDGTETAALQEFDIIVEPAAADTPGSFSLGWTAPVARADGSPLPMADIGGFRIRYGTSSGTYTHVLDVTDGSKTSATVGNLSPGAYYVVMTTYDSSGLESDYSMELVKYSR